MHSRTLDAIARRTPARTTLTAEPRLWAAFAWDRAHYPRTDTTGVHNDDGATQ